MAISYILKKVMTYPFCPRFFENVPVFTRMFPFLRESCCCFYDKYVAVFTSMMLLFFREVCFRFFENIAVFTRMLPFLRECYRFYENVAVFTRLFPFLRECCRFYEIISVFTRFLMFLRVQF